MNSYNRLNLMKIKFVKTIRADLDKPRLQEVWSRVYREHQCYAVEQIEKTSDKYSNLVLDDGDIILQVPVSAYEICENQLTNTV